MNGVTTNGASPNGVYTNGVHTNGAAAEARHGRLAGKNAIITGGAG